MIRAIVALCLVVLALVVVYEVTGSVVALVGAVVAYGAAWSVFAVCGRHA